MRRAFIISLALVLAGCKVQKTGENTYKVISPTPEAKAAGQKLKEDAKKLGQDLRKTAHEIGQTEAAAKIRAGAHEAAQGIKEGAGEAAQATGKKLQKKGRDMQNSPAREGTKTATDH
jgi:hypothetical protein